jgi:hypothetical protein
VTPSTVPRGGRLRPAARSGMVRAMRIAELRDREPYDLIARRSLNRLLTTWAGPELGFTPLEGLGGARGDGGQQWWVQEQLSAYVVPCAAPAVWAFLADGFRHTQVRSRRLAQYVLGTALASPVGLRCAGRPAFSLRSPIAGADHLVIVPGNRRMRLFDLASGRTRTLLKDGVDPGILRPELALRSAADADAPFPPILDSGPDWFDEPIVPGFALPRIRDPHVQARASHAALAQLDAWARPRAREISGQDYVEDLALRAEAACHRLGMNDVAPALFRQLPTHCFGRVTLAPSHGDCQAGNVVVSPSGTPTWIDWEFTGERSRLYDRLTWALGLRFPAGLSARVDAERHAPSAASGLPMAPRERANAIAVALLEDLVLTLEARASIGLRGAPPGLPELLLAFESVVRP